MKSLFKRLVVAALRWEARMVIRKYRPRIVAVTGSVGKTSTKDAIFAMLSGSVHVRKSEKSFNSELGLPLTILGRPNAWSNPLRWVENIFDGLLLILLRAPYPEWLVLEVGADRPGDISSLAPWLPVEVAVITRLPEVPVHVEFFDSPDAVAHEKASLIDALVPQGVLVAYADDHRLELLKHKAATRGARLITFGTSEESEVRGTAFRLHRSTDAPWPTGMETILSVGTEQHGITVEGVLGEHALYSVIGAAAVGKALGKSLAEICESLKRYEPPKGRMRLLSGLKGSLIIDDTYNSSPAAVEAALDTLALVKQARPAARTIAVLGDMLELGRRSVEEHRKIGAYAAKRVDMLVTIGFRARDIAESALSNSLPDTAIFQYENADKAGEELAAMLTEEDCVLVKGSQSMRMEKTVEDLMAEPEKAPELLVRQEHNWKKR